ncbi:hypothetical protein SVIOM74S_09910 [Streptomyces violarus]
MFRLPADQSGEPGGVGEDELEDPGQQVAGRGVGGDQHQTQMADHLLLVEAGRVPQQGGGEVATGFGPLALGQFPEDQHDALVVREGVLTALEDLGAGLDQVPALHLGQPEDAGEDGIGRYSA